jgi:hypothetical protein
VQNPLSYPTIEALKSSSLRELLRKRSHETARDLAIT